jgi:Tol biopolymer transport system component
LDLSPRTGRFEIFKMPASGGDAVQVTQNGGWGPIYSPDGKYLYYARNRGPSPILLRDGRRHVLLRMPAEGGAEQQVLEGVAERSWAPSADGIWYLWADAEKDELRFFQFRTSLSSTVLTLSKPLTPGMALSPDGKRLLFNVVDQQRSEIMLVENFR